MYACARADVHIHITRTRRLCVRFAINHLEMGRTPRAVGAHVDDPRNGPGGGAAGAAGGV